MSLYYVWQVQDKFRLDLTDEEAVHYMQSLIDVSVSATMAALMEQMHKIAQVSLLFLLHIVFVIGADAFISVIYHHRNRIK